MGDARRLLIVGGGVTGLAAAHAAVARARETGVALAVTLLERSPRLGGSVQTERVGDFVLDGGPDSWVASKPQATALAREVGLGDSLVGTRPETRRYFVAWGGELHPVPEGLVLGVPTRLAPLALTRLFSWGGKARMALEPLVPVRRSDEDESIAAFAVRRLGREAADRLVAPLLGGISAGDAEELSVSAAFPQLVAMEQRHGSLVRGMRAAARERAKAPATIAGPAAGSAFVSLAQGVGGFVSALAARLEADGVTLRTSAGVASLGREGTRYVAHLASGERTEADRVLVAVPAHAASALLASIDDDAAQALARVRFGSTATVFLGYRRADVEHPLDGVGFVVPRSSGHPILASTWVSSKWAGRAPEGHVLLRAFFGGAWGEGVLAGDDDALVVLARRELGALMGLRAEPVLERVFRFERATAQMRVGHLAAMRELKARLEQVAPGLRVAGGGYDGFGIPDCVRQGTEAGVALAT